MLELITTILKVLLEIFKVWSSWSKEEKDRFEERMKNLSGMLKDAVLDRSESMNEEAYLSNLEWEKKERYKVYKDTTYTLLKNGDGIIGMASVKDCMGFALRVVPNKNKIVEILVKEISIEEKSKQIAALMVG